ncbi:MAG: GNAT family N-acetyltransferase [Geminicoccaceae bacterium]
MTASISWSAIDLSDRHAREEAIVFARTVMEEAGEPHLRHDLEWTLCGSSTQSVVAFRFDNNEGVRGFALLLRQVRPLQFQLGELTYYRRQLTRYDLWSGPLIAGVPKESAAWRELALAFLDAVKRHLSPSFEVIGIEGLQVGSPFHQLLQHDPEIAGDFLLVDQSDPFAHQFIDLPPTLDDYLEDLGKRTKKSLAYSRRRLLRDFADDVEVTCYEQLDDVQGFLDQAMEISKKTYQWRLLGLGLRNRKALETRMRFAAEKNWLRSYILFCSGRPVAFLLGYQHGACFYYIDVGFDPDYSQWSVGSMLQVEVIEDLYARDNRPQLFDFSTGYGDHKARFGNREQEEINLLLLPRTLRHAILATAYKRLDGLANLAVSTADRIGVKQTLKKTIRRLSTSKSGDPPP